MKMTYLQPIYENETGIIYLLNEKDKKQKIQLQIGDTALLLDFSEIDYFLESLKDAKKPCNCSKCQKKGTCKQLKCNTGMVQTTIKTNKQIIEDLEALVQAVVFHYNYHKLLNTEQIASQK